MQFGSYKYVGAQPLVKLFFQRVHASSRGIFGRLALTLGMIATREPLISHPPPSLVGRCGR